MIPTSRFLRVLAMGLTLAGAVAANANSTFGQDPDGGNWHPLSPVGGTYIYSNTFTAQAGGDVLSLGAWLQPRATDASTWVKFQILGSSGGDALNGPDAAVVIAQSVAVSGISGPLSFYSGAVTAGSIVAGQTYWFALNVIGSPGTGSFDVGTASDDLQDGGGFWFSNASDGSYFDGRNLSPELAFSITVGDRGTPPPATVPDAANTGLLLVGALASLAALRRRLSAARR